MGRIAFVKSDGDWAKAEAAARNANPMPKDAVLKARLRGEILTPSSWNYDVDADRTGACAQPLWFLSFRS